MSTGTLYDKVWDLHTVRTLPTGQTQLFVGLHLIHEVTSPQAFGMLRERDLQVAFPDRTYATADHIIPTAELARPFGDRQAETMMQALETNTQSHDITFFDPDSGAQGIVHVVGPEQGLTQPGMTIVCGDSHTSTHGAFGAIGFGIGTSQIRDVLATQCIAMNKQQVRRIEVTGALGEGVYAKDIILKIIAQLGVEGGIGYVYEYGGPAIEALEMDGRMSICNMSIEGGARAGYVNPDATTFDYLKGRKYAPSGAAWDRALDYWRSIRSDADATYDDVVTIDGSAIEPMVTWGITPGQGLGISERVPAPDTLPPSKQAVARQALDHMDLEPGQSMQGVPIDVAFLGSCTNARISDLREAARLLQQTEGTVADGVRALVVPGSQGVKQQAEDEGLDAIFRRAGFEWRGAGCSMCLGMNEDQLQGRELCASSSNRNFIGRQGSKDGRTVLMSPAMVVAAAIHGTITDVRTLL
ncbi:MAG: 3-isopropylmalate dehydratase large subunit [Bacteroidetes bacterium]|jgi:3-isopropylmalate/(R)-2-methylmalate dehydratase large subunit|nr:3-isopropylmalate dehydratase large subunit [Bacteroidota bacterium]